MPTQRRWLRTTGVLHGSDPRPRPTVRPSGGGWLGKGPGALNELELIVGSIIDHGGVFTVGMVLSYAEESSFTGLVPGEPIRLDAERFERLAVGVFVELEELFVEAE